MTVSSAGPLPERRCAACHADVMTVFCPACGADAGGMRLPIVHESPEVAKLVHRLNWGAALLPGFWTFAHGAPVLGVLFWLFFIPLPPVSIAIMVYLLFNGNRVALERRRYADPDTFRRVERKWSIVGVVLTPFGLVALMMWISIALRLAVAAGAAQ